MMKKATTTKPSACLHCSATTLTRRITTYPVRLTAPQKVAGKIVMVGRVALYQCDTCGYLMPTPAGQAKVTRCVDRMLIFFLENLP